MTRIPDQCVINENEPLITTIFDDEIDIESQFSESQCILATTN